MESRKTKRRTTLAASVVPRRQVRGERLTRRIIRPRKSTGELLLLEVKRDTGRHPFAVLSRESSVEECGLLPTYSP
jgi:hypothetical protein